MLGDDECEPTRDARGYLNNKYEYTHIRKIATPSLKDLTDEQNPDNVWLATFALNILATEVDSLADATSAISQMLANIDEKASGVDDLVDGEPAEKKVEDFYECLVDDQESVITCGHVDERSKIVITDGAFASYRVSGPNPMVIRMATVDDLKLIGKEYATDKELVKLATDKQLFIVDYSSLATISPGESPVYGFAKITLGSIALFKLVGQDLAPVLIKVIGHGDNPRTKVFRPPAPDNKNIDFAWAIAKMVFQSNDSDYHEALSHLAGTHLVAETFMVATLRRLPPTHPVYKLLMPHFLGTAYINFSADQDLISDGGIVDNLVSGDIGQIRKLASLHNADVLAKDLRFPERIKARKMDKESVPNLDYPFRDDGLLHWNAIRKWVTDYLMIFYQDDGAVAADKSLGNWIYELQNDGHVKWLKDFKFGVEWLRDVIASVIFIASVEHAAVNFPQRTHMQFVPAFPLGIYGKEETIFKDKPTEVDMLRLFPPHSMIKKQAEVGYALGGVFHTQLGEYDQDPSWLSFSDYFGDIEGGDGLVVPDDYHDSIDEALTSFQHDLKLASKVIKNRNKKRRFPYITLLPESIPQSINI